MDKKPRGGARPGAGRPAKIMAPRKVSVTLSEQAFGHAKMIGNGNASKGLREIVSNAIKLWDK